MAGFFQVGETYANRIGEYEVVEVTTPTIVIRYKETGRLQEVEEELQERIVRNLRREVELANRPPEERRPSAKGKPRQRRKRARFEGFSSADFGGEITGTSWRSKTGLGGVLAQTLTDRTGELFDSWAPNRQTACYVTTAEEASAEFQHDAAMFFVLAEQSGLTYGLSVHRPADADEGATAWDRFMTTLAEEQTLVATLDDLITGGVAELSWYGETWGAAERETVRGSDDGLTLDRGAVTESDSIEAVIERLAEAPTDQGLILTIEAGMSAEDAIASGPNIGETIVDLWVQLMEFHRACKG